MPISWLLVFFLTAMGCAKEKKAAPTPTPRVTITLPALRTDGTTASAKLDQPIPLGEAFGIETTLEEVGIHDDPIAQLIVDCVRLDPSGAELIENSASVVLGERENGTHPVKATIGPIRTAGEVTLRIRALRNDANHESTSHTVAKFNLTVAQD